MIRRSLVVVLLVVGSIALVDPLPAGAAPVTETLSYTGAVQSFVVPEDVCEVTLDVYGAEGADAGGEGFLAGLGGRATATIAVTPGETLLVYVGGTPRGDEIAGGFNGGGDGGISTNNESRGYGGGGGSDVRQGGDALTDRVVVAGGGGGRGNGSSQGGDGGGESGMDGTGGTAPGGGGTQTAGGSAVGNGEPGALGAGGDAGDGFNITGGGGGGGYYGGGGGSGAPEEDANFSGGGGGGSGFGPAGTEFETGVREGDGQVDITYDDADETCPPAPPSTAAPAQAANAVAPRFTG